MSRAATRVSSRVSRQWASAARQVTGRSTLGSLGKSLNIPNGFKNAGSALPASNKTSPSNVVSIPNANNSNKAAAKSTQNSTGKAPKPIAPAGSKVNDVYIVSLVRETLATISRTGNPSTYFEAFGNTTLLTVASHTIPCESVGHFLLIKEGAETVVTGHEFAIAVKQEKENLSIEVFGHGAFKSSHKMKAFGEAQDVAPSRQPELLLKIDDGNLSQIRQKLERFVNDVSELFRRYPAEVKIVAEVCGAEFHTDLMFATRNRSNVIRLHAARQAESVNGVRL